MKYKAIFIDWDDTIGDFAGAAYRSLQEIYDAFELGQAFDSFEQFYQTYLPHNIELWEKYGRDEVTKNYLEFDRFFYPQMMAPRPISTEVAAARAHAMAAEHLRHTTDYFTPLPGAIECVQALAKKYKVIVVSNGFVSVQYKKIDASGLRKYFTDIVLSEEIGCQKPNPRFFQEALRRNDLQPEEVLMVGDGYYSDIYGAQQVGIDQAWIHDADPTADQHATYIVPSIREIAGIVE